jgi:predicted O-methyltransferase YrrM
MIEILKYQIRSWERERRYAGLTRAATFSWLLFQNARDRLSIGRVQRVLGRNGFPNLPDAAVREVCESAFGQGIRPMQCPEELAELIRRVAAANPASVLEIGTARGGTLLLLCRFAAPNAKIVSVDLPYGRNGGGYPKWKEAHYREFAQRGQSLHLIRADSHATSTVSRVAEIAGEGGFDFILIDADHSYEGVKRDYEIYRPLLAEGGLLALHDILPNERDPSIDVARFWDELEFDPTVQTERIVADTRQGMYGIGLVRG